MIRKELIEYYQARLEKYNFLLEKDKRAIGWLSLLRFLVFFGGVILAIILLKNYVIVGIVVLLCSLVFFAYLLKIYSKKIWDKEYHENMAEVNSGEIGSVKEDYSKFSEGSRFTDPSHTFSHDIDLFGEGSVFQSINRCCTEGGETMLADWMLNPLELSDSLIVRQEAINELAEMTEWRQKFTALGMMNNTSAKETASFNDWMKEESQFSGNKLLRFGLILLPLLTLVLFVLGVSSIINLSFFVIIFLINLMLMGINLAKFNRIHAKVSKKSSYLTIVSSLISHIENEEFRSIFLKDQKDGLGYGNIKAISKVRRLARILHSFDSRLNMIAGVVLNGLLLWDYQCVVRIEEWKKELAHLVPLWFESIARMDAILSFAAYAKNSPGFVYPEISEGSLFLEAEELGHHLIPSDRRVANNYIIPGDGAINIVTGANMAGKSTFLRTVAVNLVIAMCGAPVCARKFNFTPVELFTSMRTTDSLSEEESYFFAELKRLRQLVEKLEEGKKLFFILDEILKGTNSKDKSEGSKAFIIKVINLGASGLIATHDISLGALEKEYPAYVSNSCFEIEIEDGEVVFDFILRDGITTKMNAALLMKQQGII